MSWTTPIGFSRVIEVISNSKKPVVGHNALLDFVYVFNQFYKPLPETLAEFKTQLDRVLPDDLRHEAPDAALSARREALVDESVVAIRVHARECEADAREPAFLGSSVRGVPCRAEGGGATRRRSCLCHEAGFDAFMTSVCFLGLLAHNNNGELIDSSSITDEKSAEDASAGDGDDEEPAEPHDLGRSVPRSR
ncbi:hypothetical protein PINS_up023345 [Pythium insidiosum]|nr:hypothetical protein PINS_up023345 [Pythium insidiosum]